MPLLIARSTPTSPSTFCIYPPGVSYSRHTSARDLLVHYIYIISVSDVHSTSGVEIFFVEQ